MRASRFCGCLRGFGAAVVVLRFTASMRHCKQSARGKDSIKMQIKCSKQGEGRELGRVDG